MKEFWKPSEFPSWNFQLLLVIVRLLGMKLTSRNKPFCTAGFKKIVVVSLDKMFYVSYLCLVESKKQQIKEVRSKTQPENSETKATPKRVWIYLMHNASVTFS